MVNGNGTRPEAQSELQTQILFLSYATVRVTKIELKMNKKESNYRKKKFRPCSILR